MRKKFIAIALTSLLAMSLMVGCGSNAATSVTTNKTKVAEKYEKIDTDLKVGMSTDSGSIDDRSFNQGAWEGISASVENAKYLQPTGETDVDYLECIGNLYDAEYKFIVTPGYKFERAIGTAQDKYPDAKFVILDGAPVTEAGEIKIGENTVSITFAEQEGGFLAGVAAAVEMKEGDFGFIGGMPIPAVQKFNYGFQQGIKYANENLGTNITLKEENVVYQGAFDDKAGGQQIAAQMYDRGVKVIFTAAGGTGLGAITEAKSRAANGDTSVYVIGVDVDQYQDGVYDQGTNASVILTSAVKYIDRATVEMIQAEVDGNFPGGEALVFTAANNGIGIPEENPNLSEETMNKVAEVTELIKKGEITILAENDGSLLG
ncbi:MAG: BMP family ABC transporter substrate-binding protein [Cellulosilyticum sp.]|nr:BMP family ABC transporter substrate-binding protein [Cellulosilyticum sp.]